MIKKMTKRTHLTFKLDAPFFNVPDSPGQKVRFASVNAPNLVCAKELYLAHIEAKTGYQLDPDDIQETGEPT